MCGFLAPDADRPCASRSDISRETTIAAEAEALLRRSGYLAAQDVSCLLEHGELQLVGHLPTYQLKQMARGIVAEVHGAGQAVDRIEVTAPTDHPSAGRDSGAEHVGKLPEHSAAMLTALRSAGCSSPEGRELEMPDEILVRSNEHTAGTPSEPGDLTRRYDQLISAARGDAPLSAFWRLGKHVFEAESRGIACAHHSGAPGYLPATGNSLG